MRPNTFTISRLAAAADVHVETVRYYQRRRLLRQPERPIGGVVVTTKTMSIGFSSSGALR